MMTAREVFSGKLSLFTAGIVLTMWAAAPCASATTVRITFGGEAGNGYADLTLAPDPHASPEYDANASPGSSPTLSNWDPEGAWYITNASGSFNGTSITGIQATNSGTPPAVPGGYENLPNSFSWFISKTGAKSYDNLFYPDGSPLVCPPGEPPYTFHGGFLDIFGVLFALENGDFVHLWSDGITTPGAFGPDWPGGLTFGLNVYAQAADGSYDDKAAQFAGAFAAVPEPGIGWLFGAALLGLFVRLRGSDKTLELRIYP